MSDKGVKDELLGAFLDDELSARDIDRMLEALECESARGRACRQSIAASAMAGGNGSCIDISASVRAALAREARSSSVVSIEAAKSDRRSAQGQRIRRWRVPVTGVAVAASAALAAIIVTQTPSESKAVQGQQLAQSSAVNASVKLAQGQVGQRERLAALGSQAQSSVLGAPVQRVASGYAGADSGPASGGREWAIAAPLQQRPVEAQWTVVGQGGQDLLAQQRMRQQLNTMLINHARFGGGSALPGSLGYARVTAQTQQQAGH